MTFNIGHVTVLHCITCVIRGINISKNTRNKVKRNKRLDIRFLFAETYVQTKKKSLTFNKKNISKNWNIGGKMLKTVLFIAQFASLYFN